MSHLRAAHGEKRPRRTLRAMRRQRHEAQRRQVRTGSKVAEALFVTISLDLRATQRTLGRIRPGAECPSPDLRASILLLTATERLSLQAQRDRSGRRPMKHDLRTKRCVTSVSNGLICAPTDYERISGEVPLQAKNVRGVLREDNRRSGRRLGSYVTTGEVKRLRDLRSVT